MLVLIARYGRLDCSRSWAAGSGEGSARSWRTATWVQRRSLWAAVLVLAIVHVTVALSTSSIYT
jgi:hypothetical protein